MCSCPLGTRQASKLTSTRSAASWDSHLKGEILAMVKEGKEGLPFPFQLHLYRNLFLFACV